MDPTLVGSFLWEDTWQQTLSDHIEKYHDYILRIADSEAPGLRLYAADLIGESPSDAVLQERKVKNNTYISSFRNLPAAHTLELGRHPDDICASCVVGEHCTNNGLFNTDLTDTRAFQDFLEICELLSITEYEVVLEKQKQRIEKIYTSKGKALEVAAAYPDFIRQLSV